MHDTLALLERSHCGDKKARDTLFEQNTGLVYRVLRRFAGRGVEVEDLFQIGSIGLLKAIDRFDPAFEVRFSSYAVPMITGEIRRFLRDDGMLKVSRTIKEKQYRIYQMRQEMIATLGREPTTGELAAAIEISPEELVMALESQTEVESLQKAIYQGEGTEIVLEDKLPDKKDVQEILLNRIFLEELLRELPQKDRQLIALRYFQNMTQREVAERMGVSQVQISRLEKKILQMLREKGQ